MTPRRARLPAAALALATAWLPARAQDPAPEPSPEPSPEPAARDAPVEAAPAPPAVPGTLPPAAAREALDEALGFLVQSQRPDGAWGTGALDGLLEMGFSVETYYSWQVAAHGLATLALRRAEEAPERRTALDNAVRWLTTTRVPQRGNHWDTDYVWAGLYGFVACVELAQDTRFGGEGEVAAAIEARGREFWAILERTEVPTGGWAYYDDPPYSRRPSWATTFCTALVLPSLRDAVDLGWIEDDGPLRRGIATVRRGRLPSGAYTYNASDGVQRIRGGEHINSVKGSLGRMQVCNWGLATVGEPSTTLDLVREGLEAFFEHHKFLDVARMRPVPHEAYYANAGYFYLFAHYYAAEAIELLPPAEREAYRARLRPHLVKVQRLDGSATDFLGSAYMVTAGTAYTALALDLGLPTED